MTALTEPAGAPLVGREAPTGEGASAGVAYSPGLDQLRGVLIIWMMLHHANVSWVRAAFLGVETFFVMSGFLITALMLREHRSTARVNLVQFWARRARRLLPAMWVTVLLVIVVAATTGLTSMASIRGEALGTVLYVNNWRQILASESYFATFTEVPLLQHTWSLAIEEQFYLFWPPLLVACLWVAGGRRRVVVTCIAVALSVSVLWAQAAAHLTDDVNRLYQGADTRLPGLLIGGLVAALLEGHTFGPRALRLIRWVALPGALGCMVAIATLGETDPFTYRGGLLLYDVAAVALLPVLVSGARRPKWATRPVVAPAREVGRVLRHLGILSYGLYLMHLPVFLVLSESRTGLSGASLLAVRVIASVVVVEVSYRFIEGPIRFARWSPRATLSAAGVGTALLVALVLALPQTTTTAAGAQGLQERAAERGFEIVDGVAQPIASQATANLPGVPGEPATIAVDAPAASPGDLVVGVAGDSAAWTLVWGHAVATQNGRITGSVHGDATLIGCGVVLGQPITQGQPYGTQGEQCASWRKRWTDMVDASDPDVSVVLLGGWETLDWELDGVHYRSGTPEHIAMIETLVREGTALLQARGGTVALLSFTCVALPDAGQHPSALREWVDPNTTGAFNDMLGRVALEQAGVEYLDLRAAQCPDGVYDNEMDGVELFTDGIHYTQDGAEVVWDWLLPRLEQMARRRP